MYNINYNELLDLIRDNFNSVMQDDPISVWHVGGTSEVNVSKDYYGDTKVVVTSEQQYIRGSKEPNKIYIVVKFGAANVFFGQSVLPVTITAISEKNHCYTCQTLLSEFAQKFNLTKANNIQQIYDTPVVLQNFNEIFDGFRSLLSLSGSFVIAKDINDYDYYFIPQIEKFVEGKVYFRGDMVEEAIGGIYKYCNEDGVVGTGDLTKWTEFVKWAATTFYPEGTISFYDNGLYRAKYDMLGGNPPDKNEGWDFMFSTKIKIPEIFNSNQFDTNIDSQAFYGSHNIAHSVGKVSSYSVSFSTYLFSNNRLVNDCLEIISLVNGDPSALTNINKKFTISLQFTAKTLSGVEIVKPITSEMKLINFALAKNIGELPVIALTFGK